MTREMPQLRLDPRTSTDEQYAADPSRSPFLLQSDPAASETILRLGVVHRYRTGEMIYRQGETSSSFYQTVTGRVRIYIAMPDGSERILSYGEPGASFGEAGCFDGLPRYATCVASVDSDILCVRNADVLAAARSDPPLMVEIARRIAHKQRVLSMHIAMDGQPARIRVAHLLLNMTQTYGRPDADGQQVVLTGGHRVEDLAVVIGVTRVTMSRELSRLSSEGVVGRSGRNLSIVDLAALTGLASSGV